MQEVKKAKSTIKGYEAEAARVKRRFGERPIALGAGTKLEHYQAELIRKKKLDPKTVNDIFTLIRIIFRAARARPYCP
ncbi:MAG: phage integrase N-terminal SAM-like domain-containing protein [Halioglobus sp.]|nr:phage integrase N-terminal SAM-like domain-containing protein [Halioglobus sp.]